MTIRNPVLFGLKVNFNFTDVLSKNQCLENLGLQIRDLDVIRGISETSLTKLDLQNVSGLDINLTRYIDRLKSDTSLYSDIVLNRGTYRTPLQGNFEAFGAISGGAIRFNYIPNDAGSGLTEDDLKFGDISTSRVSSWSSATDDETEVEQAISYGASVRVRDTIKIGQKENFTPDPLLSIINVLDTPEPIRFDTEVATDILKIKINGADRYVYAMRGIPVVFTTAFKSLALDLEVISIGKNPIYTIKDVDDEDAQEITSRPNITSSGLSRLRYNAPSFKERQVKVYFPPNNIELIKFQRAGLISLPPVKFLNLTRIELQLNLITEIPDFNVLNYQYDIDTPTNPPTSSLRYIDLSENPLYLTENTEYSKWGTYAASRLPKNLQTLRVNGTYIGEQTWQNVENFVVVKATESEFNLIECDPTSTQTYSFEFELQGGGGTQVTEVSGIYYDKINFTAQELNNRYVYIKNPKTTANEPVGADWEQFIRTRYNGSSEKLDVLDLSTRCPNLESYVHIERKSRRLFLTPLSKYPDIDNNNLFDYITDIEYTPRVELRTIKTYNLGDNRFTKLNPIFISPQNYLGVTETSTLERFTVSNNGTRLTEPDGAINFNKMDDIISVNISYTDLPIPIGLSSKTKLNRVDLIRTRFPARTTATPPSQYDEQLPNGGFINSVTGEGNPSNVNNFFFSNKYPVNQGEYIFINCESLGSISAASSRMDGMIPKFIGNDKLFRLDLRNTPIEGGRPPMPTNNGISGRRFVMWDDTFADCSNTLRSLRISGPNLGRNIGEYDPVSKQYTAAAFQGSTFNLPFLNRLEIISTNRLLKGEFFSLSGLSSIQYLYSFNSGWGEDLPDGAPLPAISGKTRLIDVRLYGNNFSGQINLNALPKLQRILLQNNNLEGFGQYTPGSSLKLLNVSNNPNLSGSLPDFSVGSPNIETISLSGCNLSSYSSGTIVDLPRLRSLDLSSNSFNASSIDAILSDALSNYTANPRGGVVINLTGGNNSAPSRNQVQIPTTTTTINSYTITVAQPSDPGDPNIFTFFTRGANGILSQGESQLDLKTGVDPTDENITYNTKILRDGADVTSSVSIDFINNSITFPSTPNGGGFPPTGTEIKFVVETTVNGFIIEETGGFVTVNTLRSNGWTIRTN